MPEIGIADKETLDKIDTNVGAKTDAASSTGSLHAKVRDAKNAINAGNSTVNTINTNVGAETDAASATGSLHAKSANIINVANTIKSSIDSGVLPRPCLASNNQKYIDTTEKSTKSSQYTKMYEISVMVSGTVRVSFKMRSTGASGAVSYGQIYINGSPAGIVRSTSAWSYVEFIEDIGVGAGDRLQLWIRGNGLEYAYVRDFKVSFDITTPVFIIKVV